MITHANVNNVTMDSKTITNVFLFTMAARTYYGARNMIFAVRCTLNGQLQMHFLTGTRKTLSIKPQLATKI
jgi:hypothetical protein